MKHQVLRVVRARQAAAVLGGDPLHDHHSLDEKEAYRRLHDMPDDQIDNLIDLLVVECITAHLQRPTPLVRLLARELGVNVRRYWRPDAEWLKSYQKAQLAHLIGELCGPVFASAALRRKKSELVDELAKLFNDAAEGRLTDPERAERVNTWLPAYLRDDGEADSRAVVSVL